MTDATTENRYGERIATLPLLVVCESCGHKEPASYNDYAPGNSERCEVCNALAWVRRKYISEQTDEKE